VGEGTTLTLMSNCAVRAGYRDKCCKPTASIRYGFAVTVRAGGLGGGSESVTTDSSGNFAFPIVPAGTAAIDVTVLGSI